MFEAFARRIGAATWILGGLFLFWYGDAWSLISQRRDPVTELGAPASWALFVGVPAAMVIWALREWRAALRPTDAPRRTDPGA